MAEQAGVARTPRAVIDSRVVVTGVTLDSRAIRPGDLYAALPGANVHGARFVGGAVGLGAVAVLTDPAGAALLALNRASQALWPDFAREVEAASGLPVGFRDEGTLVVALDRDHFRRAFHQQRAR